MSLVFSVFKDCRNLFTAINAKPNALLIFTTFPSIPLILSVVETAAYPVALTPVVNTCSWSVAFLSSSLFVMDPITFRSLSASPSQYDDSFIFVCLLVNAVSWFNSFSFFKSMFTLIGFLLTNSLASETARLTCTPSLSLLLLMLSWMSLADTFLNALLISLFSWRLSIFACIFICRRFPSICRIVWFASFFVSPFARIPTSLNFRMPFSSSLICALICVLLFC